MRVIARMFCATVLAASMASAGSLVGWISDASCGASNASSSAEARECAKRCIKDGAAPVFVSEADKKVYKLTGKGNAKDHLDHKVKIKGEIKGDTITVTEIEKAS
jgi:hypothetical protein